MTREKSAPASRTAGGGDDGGGVATEVEMARVLKVRLTEEEWLKADEVISLDLYRSASGRTRKWRLFGCACARRVLVFLSNAYFSEVVAAAERLADGELTW